MFDFGENLRRLRERQKLSQKELGRRVGRADSVISNYENNLKTPPLDVLLSFAAIFNVSLDYLVGIEKSEMVSIEALGPKQRELIRSIVTELKHKSTPGPGRAFAPAERDPERADAGICQKVTPHRLKNTLRRKTALSRGHAGRESAVL